MSVAAVPAASVDLQRSPRALSRRRAIRWFRWSILGPLIVLLAVVLMPVLLLQLYFSFHQWSVYLGSWSEAEYVGLDLFGEVLTDPRFGWAVVRSLMPMATAPLPIGMMSPPSELTRPNDSPSSSREYQNSKPALRNEGWKR